MNLFDTIAQTVRETGGDERIAQRIEARLRSEYGTSRQYIPAPDKRGRNADIRAAYDGGMSRAKIARRFGLHPSTIGRILADSRGFGSDEWKL